MHLEMSSKKVVLFYLFLLIKTVFCDNEGACEIDFNCEECLPDHMPMISSHQLNSSRLIIASGEKITFLCHKAKFLLYADKNRIQAFCEENKYRLIDDTSIRHLAELGCQANYFEDIIHHVNNCGAPLQGRSYQYQDMDMLAVRHLAELCYDEDSARTVFARVSTVTGNDIPQTPHSDRASPLSFVGNFNQMLDSTNRIEADKLYSDEKRMNKRLRELLKHKSFNFADQTLEATDLISPAYLKDQNMMVTKFPTNKIAIWRSIVRGNMQNVQKDVLKLSQNLLSVGTPLDIYVGTHDTLTLRSDSSQVKIYLKTNERFPVSKYVWTVVYDEKHHKALAIVTLNNPFVSVSDIRDSNPCTSICNQISWLNNLKQNKNFETPLYGLVFCCDIHSLATKVPVPRRVLDNVHVGDGGVLKKSHVTER